MFYVVLFFIFHPYVEGLASESYETREKSQEVLKKYDWISWRVLTSDFKDLEQKKRASRLVKGVFNLSDPPVIGFCTDESRIVFYEGEIQALPFNPIFRQFIPEYALHDYYRVKAWWVREKMAESYEFLIKMGIPYQILERPINVFRDKERRFVASQK